MAENLGDIIGNSIGEAAAFAAGIAVGPLLQPLVRALENETWSQYPEMPAPAQMVAQGVAEGKIDAPTGQNEALNTGYGTSVFPKMVDILRTAPSLAQAFDLIRRGQMDPSNLPTVIQRTGSEAQWIAFYEALSSTGLEPWEQPVSPADLSLGLIRGNLPNFDAPSGPAFPPGLPYANSNVPLDPVLDLDVVKEAAASGVDADRMALLARNVGLPPGVIEGLNMLNRGIINEDAFGLLVAQSDARLAWGPFLIQLRRMLLSPHEYVEARLRGWIKTDDEMYAGTALHGLNQGDTDLLFELTGRPIPVHQVTKGAAYLADNGGSIDLTDEELLAVEQSNVRPPWYQLDVAANRYAWPSYFVLKALTPGTITVDRCAAILRWSGWEPDLAMQTAQSFAAGSGTGGNKHITSSTTALVTAARKAYIGRAASEAQARTALDAASVDAATQDQLIALWDAQRTLEALPVPPAV